MFVNKRKFSFILIAAAALFASQAAAQDIGGSLGSSAGIFRPKNPGSAAKTAKAPAKSIRVGKQRVKPSRNQSALARAKRAGKNVKTPANSIEQLEALIQAGNEARDQRAFINAEHAYGLARELDPRDSRAVYGLGNIYTDQQRWDDAEVAYREALKIEPKQAESNIALCYVLLQPNRGGNVAARFAEAELAARRAIEIDPANPMAHDQLGVALELRGLPARDAENAFRRAIDLAPDFALAWAHLARLLKKVGRADESAQSYKQAVEFAQDVPMMILVAEVLQSENKFLESEKLIRRAAQIDRDNPTVLFLLGRALAMLGNFAESEDYLTRSIKISPRTFAVYNSLAVVYLRQGKIEDAERILTEAVPLATAADRRQLAGIYGFGGVGDGYLKRGDRVAALRVYQKALEFDDKNSLLNEKIAAAKNKER